MTKTPLELYSSAYDLHYNRGRIADACALYKDIIRLFPDSNECGYSAIQLEKIGAEEAAGKIKTSRGLWPLYLLLMLNLAALTLLAGAHFRLVRKVNSTRATVLEVERESLDRYRKTLSGIMEEGGDTEE